MTLYFAQDIGISINNSEVSTTRFGVKERSILAGQAVLVSSAVPNGLSGSFNFSNPFVNFFANLFRSKKANYFVLETDYTTYALGLSRMKLDF